MGSVREFVGRVTREPFGLRSKSEHLALYLQTDEGDFVLRREGGNPFNDPELEQLVGKTIRCRGHATDYLLIISEWSDADGQQS